MNIGILGIPMDLGAGRRGVDMGASALRYARISETLRELGHSVRDLGNVPVAVVETIVKENGKAQYLEEIRAACQNVAETLNQLEPDVFPICLGGDHSISIGTVAGAARGQRRGLIWVDAHTDFNTPDTSPSGNIHGMPVASLLGVGDERLVNVGGEGKKIRAQDVVMIGIRSVDTQERNLLLEHDIKIFTMKDIDRLGMARVATLALEHLAHLEHWHVSFDADSLDPSIAPGVGTPVAGGLSYREAHLLMELLSDSGRVSSLDLVEVNPVLDRENMTAALMVEMTASLLGKKIL
ncbi:MAG: arginase [Deinococcales bacterium]